MGCRLSCGEVHAEDEDCLGEPICPECFDYELAVLWNALAPELWRRTAIQIPRELARLTGLSHRELRRRIRVSYVKVAEYQRRGALHFHIVMRLDRGRDSATGDGVEVPEAEFTCELLGDAVRAAVAHVAVSAPVPDDEPGAVGREVRWGRELEVRPLDSEPECGGVGVRGVHREVRDEVDRGRRRPHPSARRRRPEGSTRTAACAPLRRVRVGGSEPSRICARCGCGSGRTRWGSAGTASRRAGATRRRSRRCAAQGTSTCSSASIQRGAGTRGVEP
jgi:hypothetical protein